jgi:hypothetical protein
VARTFDEIDAAMADWIGRQPMFFVASAPLDGDGHVNLSPKGPIGTLRVLGPHEVAYLDFTGSGAETIAHLRENGRIVVMLCAYEGPPQIVRLHGRGEAILPDDDRFAGLVDRFDSPVPDEALRAVIRIDVERIARSCGYSVPLMAYEGERRHAPAWAEKKLRAGGAQALQAYRDKNNAVSIDGLPAVT